VWLSLVEHLVRDEGVAGSNPATPTNKIRHIADQVAAPNPQPYPEHPADDRGAFSYVPLTHARLLEALHYDPDTGVFTRLKCARPDMVGKRAGGVKPDGYRVIGVDGRWYRAARLAYPYMTGAWPPHVIDHKNHRRDDDRWSNLRPATDSQNSAYRLNQKKRSGLPEGVRRKKHRFDALIGANGKQHHLGSYATAEDAADAYQRAAHKFFGEFATPRCRDHGRQP
jgi:hypothetical protein